MNDKPKGENQVKGIILVTGATGFVGHFLCGCLLAQNSRVRGTLLTSENPALLVDGVEPVTIEPLGIDTQWSHALADVDTIIHLAARVHIIEDKASDPLTEFRRVNVDGTAQLAREAAKLGVRRFIFISSIKVNGEESATAYTPDSPPNPSDPYGISKWEAEQALRKIEAETGMEVVVIRPTLVYGPGVKANFLNMLKIISRGIPLPLDSVTNKRSLIYAGNLVDALATCATHQEAAGKTYLVSDGVDVSTPELARRIGKALGVPARLFPVPISLLTVVASLVGKSYPLEQLTGSLRVNSSMITKTLGWRPPFTMEEGLRETAIWFNNIYELNR
jgi:nucleoside-diphosphate-sugar epimerase